MRSEVSRLVCHALAVAAKVFHQSRAGEALLVGQRPYLAGDQESPHLVERLHHVDGLSFNAGFLVVQWMARTPRGQKNAVCGRFVASGKVEQVHAHRSEYTEVVGSSQAWRPKKGPRKPMLQRHDGEWKFTGLRSELEGIREHHQFWSEVLIGEGFVVVHPLPRDGKKLSGPVLLTRICVLERRGENVPEIHFVMRCVSSKIRRREGAARPYAQHGRNGCGGRRFEGCVRQRKRRVPLHQHQGRCFRGGRFSVAQAPPSCVAISMHDGSTQCIAHGLACRHGFLKSLKPREGWI